MSKDIVASENDLKIARIGIMNQIQSFSPMVREFVDSGALDNFIDNQIKVIAAQSAEIRKLRAILHRELLEDAKPKAYY